MADKLTTDELLKLAKIELPLHVGKDRLATPHPAYTLSYPDGFQIATLNIFHARFKNEADKYAAEYFCRAVNSFEALREVATGLKRQFDNDRCVYPHSRLAAGVSASEPTVLELINRALRLAEGEGEQS